MEVLTSVISFWLHSRPPCRSIHKFVTSHNQLHLAMLVDYPSSNSLYVHGYSSNTLSQKEIRGWISYIALACNWLYIQIYELFYTVVCYSSHMSVTEVITSSERSLIIPYYTAWSHWYVIANHLPRKISHIFQLPTFSVTYTFKLIPLPNK